MLSTVILAIYVVVFLLLSLPYLAIVKLVRVIGLKNVHEKMLEVFVQFFGKSVIRVVGANVEVEGLENLPKGNVLFVGNHQSYADIPIMLGFIPGVKSFIAKKETRRIPVVSWWMVEINCVFLDRQNLRQGMKDMAKAKEFLQEGRSMVIYPEGTRSQNDDMGEFKKGSLKIAQQANVPVVPVAILGSYKLYEQQKKIKKAEVKLTIGEPIFIEKLSKEEQKEIAEIAENRVRIMLKST
ncbi:1-acyl-sn-glycerol-3-phosphate acyltransferase [Alkalicella caledoniensis]|uniref:1-acyl-sn-glycerol-3-phosphate acyltransferase n=1 Tax=Alkalicella caledoniensis TaxID=2731377 RepID=A0A7G9W8U3_ALKCA|nr:lysophospholipid acyltransferase family protein [Alkalicella caledoniensis]QNO15105.1 1-acyl-sn-glycerol-3-phosphate acyltransferase [Alkalicella caledoniensis]